LLTAGEYSIIPDEAERGQPLLPDTMYVWLIFSAYLLIQLFKYLLDWLNVRRMEKRSEGVPPEYGIAVDAGLLKKSRSYLIDQTKLSAVESAFMSLVILIFFFGGALDRYSAWIAAFNLPFPIAGWIFFILLCFGGQALAIPFSLFHEFKLERRYGFATTTVRLWVLDLVKEVAISALILSFLTCAGLWLISRSPDFWWLWFWALISFFSMVMTYIAPYVIGPLFNKFTPLEDDALRQRILDLARRAGISAQKVLKMDASTRTRHSNAYFTGLGKAKRIVLFDTLLEGTSHGEIVAVLAHEIGHWKRHHILKGLLVFEAGALIGLYLLFQVTRTGFLTSLFRISADTFFTRVTVAAFLGSMLVFLLRPVIMAFTRRMEREADRFSLGLTQNAEDLAGALVRLSKDNLSNPYPHPLYVAFYYSHPPVLERIRALREAERHGSGVRGPA
jgi:STE24 endopeptidase